MDNLDEKTRISSRFRRAKVESIIITYSDEGVTCKKTFAKAFKIGRSAECDLVLMDQGVSREHAEVIPTDTGWIIRDLDSSNGTFVNTVQIDEQLLSDQDTFHFGNDAAIFLVSFEKKNEEPLPRHQKTHSKVNVANPPIIQAKNNLAKTTKQNEVFDHYFADKAEEDMGDHTRMVRRVIKQEQEKEQKKNASRYKIAIVAVLLLLIVSGGFITFQQVRLDKAQKLAIDMFYDIKAIEVQIVQTEVQSDGVDSLIHNIAQKRQKLREMKARYQDYLAEVNYAKQFKSSLSEEDQAIVKMAKIFGECDLELPEDFIFEVKKYIRKWQSSKRLVNAINRIDQLGHTSMVVKAMKAENLPPEFLFVSLQESNFRFDAIGPETRFGIAKGAWQFMPETGKEYGLKVGPLAPFREHDPDDERFDFEKSSIAAAKYLKKIYSMEAQASGLLVMASYNWGHNRVKRLIKSMPDNPRERNFWKLTQNYKIPKETYDYVFYIFSAAVIGDNPELFGFDFKSPV